MTAKEKQLILNELKKREAKKELARRNLLDFVLYTKENYEVNWHHSFLCKKLTEFANGKIKKLMIFLPPQHGKTELATRRMSAFLLGKYPNKKIAVSAYNHTIASGFNRDIQRIIDDITYKRLFPNTQLQGMQEDKSRTWLRNSDEFEIVNNTGSLVSVGVGGALTSRKVDILIIDDIYKDAKEAWSPLQRQNVQEWYNTTAETRLHNDSQVLIVFTRWHEQDLGGYILANEGKDWEVVSLPAIKEYETIEDDKREIGEALWESRHSRERLLKIKAKDTISFESLYQQNPKPQKGLMYANGFKTYTISELPKDTPIFSYTDTADTGADYLCTVFYTAKDGKIFIIDVIYTKEDMSVTIPLWASKHAENKVTIAKIEYNNGGHPFALYAEDKLRNHYKYYMCTIEGFHQTANKQARILSQASYIQENFYFPQEWHLLWSEFYGDLHRYQREGKNAHDDCADTLTGIAETVSENVQFTMLL